MSEFASLSLTLQTTRSNWVLPHALCSSGKWSYDWCLLRFSHSTNMCNGQISRTCMRLDEIWCLTEMCTSYSSRCLALFAVNRLYMCFLWPLPCVLWKSPQLLFVIILHHSDSALAFQSSLVPSLIHISLFVSFFPFLSYKCSAFGLASGQIDGDGAGHDQGVVADQMPGGRHPGSVSFLLRRSVARANCVICEINETSRCPAPAAARCCLATSPHPRLSPSLWVWA